MARSVSFHPAGVPFHILAKCFFFHFSSVDFTCVGNAGKEEKLVRAIPPEYKIRSVAAAVSCYCCCYCFVARGHCFCCLFYCTLKRVVSYLGETLRELLHHG